MWSVRNESTGFFFSHTTMDGSQPTQGLPKRPSETTSYFEDWRAWAWKVGQYASAYAKAGPTGCEQYVRMAIRNMHFTDEQKESLVESYNTAYRRCRKPPDAPERVAECVRWFEKRWGDVRTTERIGRSPAYPKLLLFAYGLGRDGRPFTFAKNRIASVSGIHEFTVLKFIEIAVDKGWLIVVRDGMSGLNGMPTWYRIQNPIQIYSLLALDRKSYMKEERGATFEDMLRARLPSVF